MVAALLFAFLAALAVSRFSFRGRKAFIVTILVVQMIPAEGLFISNYQMLDGWELVNTIIGLALVYLAAILPFTIWMLRGFVAGVPDELEEAAMIDGCRAPARSSGSRSRCSPPAWSRPASTGSCRRGTSTPWPWS